MSSALLKNKTTNFSQLCFPWMQPEKGRLTQPLRAAARTVHPKEARPYRRTETLAARRPAPRPNSFEWPNVQLSREDSIKFPVASQAYSKPGVSPTGTVTAFSSPSGDRSQRVGQVRLGAVMLSLLKRYGITEEEILAELAAIAQEQSSQQFARSGPVVNSNKLAAQTASET